jgi:hypothetical protein
MSLQDFDSLTQQQRHQFIEWMHEKEKRDAERMQSAFAALGLKF